MKVNSRSSAGSPGRKAANTLEQTPTQSGTVVEWLKPFSFKVRLESSEVIICGLERSYFGRILPKQASRQIEMNGPHPGDGVLVIVSADRSAGIRTGVILKRRQINEA